MSGTNQNPYPSCIKCNTELSPQDSRGWEKIAFPDGKGIDLISKEIWLCPNCIAKFQHTKDLLSLVDIEILKLKNESSCSMCHEPFGVGDNRKNYFKCDLQETEVSYKICKNCFDYAFHISAG